MCRVVFCYFFNVVTRVLLFYFGILDLVACLLQCLCFYVRLFILMCSVFSRLAGFVVLGFVPCCSHRMDK